MLSHEKKIEIRLFHSEWELKKLLQSIYGEELENGRLVTFYLEYE